MWTPEHASSVLVAHGISCPEAYGMTRDWTHIPCTGRWILNHWITREVPLDTVLNSGPHQLRSLVLQRQEVNDVRSGIFKLGISTQHEFFLLYCVQSDFLKAFICPSIQHLEFYHCPRIEFRFFSVALHTPYDLSLVPSLALHSCYHENFFCAGPLSSNLMAILQTTVISNQSFYITSLVFPRLSLIWGSLSLQDYSQSS